MFYRFKPVKHLKFEYFYYKVKKGDIMKKMLFLAVLLGFSGIKAASAESKTSKKGWIPQWVYSTVEYGRPYA